MKELKKEKFERILEKIQNNPLLIRKLVKYLEINNLLSDLHLKLYYIVEKSEPLYNITYYKDKKNNKLISLYEASLLDAKPKSNLEKKEFYVYEERKTLYFAKSEVSVNTIRFKQDVISYEKDSNIIYLVNSISDEINEIDWVKFIRENPLLFVQILAYYDVNMNELDNIDEKSYTYKKEIKKN